jgi:hypothetical protein
MVKKIMIGLVFLLIHWSSYSCFLCHLCCPCCCSESSAKVTPGPQQKFTTSIIPQVQQQPATPDCQTKSVASAIAVAPVEIGSASCASQLSLQNQEESSSILPQAELGSVGGHSLSAKQKATTFFSEVKALDQKNKEITSSALRDYDRRRSMTPSVLDRSAMHSCRGVKGGHHRRSRSSDLASIQEKSVIFRQGLPAYALTLTGSSNWKSPSRQSKNLLWKKDGFAKVLSVQCISSK